jgi:hypothetical protein
MSHSISTFVGDIEASTESEKLQTRTISTLLRTVISIKVLLICVLRSTHKVCWENRKNGKYINKH